MKNIKILLYIFLILSCFVLEANARVQFLPAVSGGSVAPKKRTQQSASQKCISAGYQKGCGKANPYQICPYANGYYKCCPEEYQTTKKQCSANGGYCASLCGGYCKCIY